MAVTKIQAAQYMTARSQRRHAYKKEADPLMALFLNDEIEKSVWQNKKAEIKAQFSYPEGCDTAELEQFCKDNGYD
tara:strand:+ start:244 stop:471 length:228 start_codon:yes stop_codon:yes gene_type:complete